MRFKIVDGAKAQRARNHDEIFSFVNKIIYIIFVFVLKVTKRAMCVFVSVCAYLCSLQIEQSHVKSSECALKSKLENVTIPLPCN